MHNSEQAWLLQRQAEQCNDLRRYEQAIELAQQSLTLDPNFAFAYGSMCRAYIGLRQFKKAEQLARQALSLQSENDWFLRMLAISLRFQKRPRRALVPAQESVRIAPMSANAHIELAACLTECRNFPKAHLHIDKAIELAPMDATAHFAKGFLLLEQKLWTDAERKFRDALRLDPTDPLTLNNLGVCLNNQKKYQDAALAFKTAVLLDPNLKLAKQNTLQTVNLIKAATPVKTALLLLIFSFIAFVRFTIKDDTDPNDSNFFSNNAAIVVLIFAFVILVLGLMHFWFRRKIHKQIETEDPELHELYNRIKKHG